MDSLDSLINKTTELVVARIILRLEKEAKGKINRHDKNRDFDSLVDNYRALGIIDAIDIVKKLGEEMTTEIKEENKQQGGNNNVKTYR